MKLISHLTLTLTLASALDATASKRNRSLAIDVTLSRLGNTTIAANITSNADLPLKLIKYGNILDDSPYFSKVNVNSSNGTMEYFKTYMSLDINTVEEESFEYIPARGSVFRIFDLTDTHTLSGAGLIQLQSVGMIPYTWLNLTRPLGNIPYESNILHIPFTEEDVQRTKTLSTTKSKRTIVAQGTCDEYQMRSLEIVHKTCSRHAGQAGKSALLGSDGWTFQHWFGIDNEENRKLVAARYFGIMEECANWDKGKTKTFCIRDNTQVCPVGIVAITLSFFPVGSRPDEVTYCGAHFDLPMFSYQCGESDQLDCVIHELSHSEAVHPGRTQDFAYGYDESAKLPPEKALYNADTYQWYASDRDKGCRHNAPLDRLDYEESNKSEE